MTVLDNSSAAVVRDGSPRADVVSGYVLAACRVGAWAGVSAVVARHDGPSGFALLALLRGTISLVGYTSLGLGPAMVRALAGAAVVDKTAGGPARANEAPGEAVVYATGVRLAVALAAVAMVVTVVYARLANQIHVVPHWLTAVAGAIVVYFGVGVASRAATEPMSAALQSRGRLAIDNAVLAAAELAWVGMVVVAARQWPQSMAAVAAALWCAASVGASAARLVARRRYAPDLGRRAGAYAKPVARGLLGVGAAIVVAQLADFLYAPTDYVIINRLIGPDAVAAYAPAVQIDAALLLAVAGIAAAVYPWASVAHAAGDLARVRRLYVRGTLASLAVLVPAAVLVIVLARPMLWLWLGTDQWHTRQILPLVLVHTVAGGAGAVGRSVLLGMGRARAFTASVLVAGAAHVAISGSAAALGFGLKGVVVGTIVVVVARSLAWQPWYVMRALREDAERRVVPS